MNDEVSESDLKPVHVLGVSGSLRKGVVQRDGVARGGGTGAGRDDD
ncbi:MAG: hypothetical protein ACREJQ_04340 [bacterium]